MDFRHCPRPDWSSCVRRKLENEHVLSFLENFNVEKIGLESSTYVVPLYRALVDRGFRVEVGHPKKTRYIAEARIKSDRVDSKAIAELVRLEALPRAHKDSSMRFANRLAKHKYSNVL